MKAAAYTRYGLPDVVQIMDVEKPVPKDNEVLVKVRAVSLNPADWRSMGGAPYVFRVLFRLRSPRPRNPVSSVMTWPVRLKWWAGTKEIRFSTETTDYWSLPLTLPRFKCEFDSRRPLHSPQKFCAA
jgi:hypothetical protein